MTSFEIFAVIISITALFGWINERFIKLPTAIGLMVVSLLMSLGLIFFATDGMQVWVKDLLVGLDFNDLVMNGMLSVLLFAGALHVNLNDLSKQGWPIFVLASVGVITSTFIVGTLTYYMLNFFDLHISYTYALVFGALISPTDPIAVLSILKSIGVRKDVETLITGESLFNDGVGVVVFSVIVGLLGTSGAHGGHGEDAAHAVESGNNVMNALTLFGQEAIGGVIFGLVLGYLGYQMLKSIDSYPVEVMVSLAVVVGGYALAHALHTSGPLAMVVAGLLLGNQGRRFAMSDTTRDHLDKFWEMMDEILNSVLFVLIGMELLVIVYNQQTLTAALIAIPIVLLGRFIAVGLPISLFRMSRTFPKFTVRLLVWGGLRGGISVALALSLAHGPERDIILALTYAVVVFAIIIQGLTVGQIAKRIPSA